MNCPKPDAATPPAPYSVRWSRKFLAESSPGDPELLKRAEIRLRHCRTGVQITFSRFRRLGRWLWRDSRDSGPGSRRQIVAELARLLYGGDAARAEALCTEILERGVVDPVAAQAPAALRPAA